MKEQDVLKTTQLVGFVGMAWNIGLSSIKIVAGVLYSSQALIADGIHSVSDLATDIAVIVGVKYWSAPPDESHPYGHAKIETLVTAFIGMTLAGVGITIGWEVVMTILRRESSNPGHIALYAALLSIISKEILYHWTIYKARQINSNALKANAWHHRSDAISSVPVVIAILVSFYFPEFPSADSIGALIVSGFIVHSAWGILKPTLLDLSGAVDKECGEKIKETALTVPGVISVHTVRARIFGAFFHADLHVMVDPDISLIDGYRISHAVKYTLRKDPNLKISGTVIHLEPYTPGGLGSTENPIEFVKTGEKEK